MAALTRRSFVATLLPLASAFPAQESASNPKTIDDFFREFTGDWVRADPDLATRTRFLTGAEQDRLEQRLSPWTRAWKHERIHGFDSFKYLASLAHPVRDGPCTRNGWPRNRDGMTETLRAFSENFPLNCSEPGD